MEIIPIIWSVGYGGWDPDYAAALPCTNVPFAVKGGKAVFSGGGADTFTNPGFDDPPKKPNVAPGWAWIDKPGTVSFIDTDVKSSGAASLRLENYGDNAHGHGRACHLLKVGPSGRYKVSCKFKTDGVKPASGLQLQIYTKDGQSVAVRRPGVASTQDWTRVECTFDAASGSEFRVYAGIWGGKAGRFWLDDFKVEDMGCSPPLLREGLPFTVRDAKTGAELRAGVDYELPPQSVWNKKWDSFRILRADAPETREGTELVADYWTAAVVAGGQRPCCMSAPALYDYYRASAAAVKEALNPRKWFLSMDEIRAGAYADSGSFSSLTKIMRRFGVSRPSAVRSVAELKRMGLVAARKGAGTFVLTKNRTIGLAIPGTADSEFFSAIMDGIVYNCNKCGMDLVAGDVFHVDHKRRASQAERLARHFAAIRVGGVIMQPVGFAENADSINGVGDIMRLLPAGSCPFYRRRRVLSS